MGVAERKVREREARRQAILDAARDCFFSDGFESTTISQIADTVELSTGTLYGALRRLLEDGWIRRAGDMSVSEAGRVRKVYALTDLGWRILNAEVARLEMLVTAVHLRAAPGQP